MVVSNSELFGQALLWGSLGPKNFSLYAMAVFNSISIQIFYFQAFSTPSSGPWNIFLALCSCEPLTHVHY